MKALRGFFGGKNTYHQSHSFNAYTAL